MKKKSSKKSDVIMEPVLMEGMPGMIGMESLAPTVMWVPVKKTVSKAGVKKGTAKASKTSSKKSVSKKGTSKKTVSKRSSPGKASGNKAGSKAKK